MTLSRRSTLLYSLALSVLAALVYWPGLSGGFIFDDYPNIVSNTRIHAQTLSWEAIVTASQGYQGGGYGRPLATISFALDYLISDTSAYPFKLTSLIVHLINALLVFWLLRRVLALPRDSAERPWPLVAAFAIALLWAIHPMQVSTVLYVVQRMETLSLTFVLLALIAYMRGRTAQRNGDLGWPWLATSAVLACLGMASKESAVLFPVYALCLELTVLDFDAKAERTRRFLKIAYAAGLLAAIVLFVAWVLPQYATPGNMGGRDFTLAERLLSQLRILPAYIGQMLLPLPSSLTFYYDNYPISTGLLSPATTLAGGLFLLGLLAFAWLARRRMPLASLGILWFFAAHLLTSNVFNLELRFEHRNYFALLGVLMALADLARRIPMHDGPGLKYVALGALLVAFGGMTAVRSATWGNQILLANELAERNPASARASNDYAEQLMNLSGMDTTSRFYPMAVREFERGSRLPGASPLPEQGLILMAASSGQVPEAAWWDRLNEKIRTRPIGPQEQGAVHGLLNHRFKGMELDDKQLSLALSTLFRRSLMPRQGYVDYGVYAQTYLHDDALATRLFVRSLDRGSPDPSLAGGLAADLIRSGYGAQAKAVMQRASELGLTQDPRFKAALNRTDAP
ncbi:hypothetical protein [Montanilutibacter psychrotolerans]|uniref:Tetratricopeptide repeat protein n=1 Tax=Montanilutibacter psychrotolerans TaxID=1327343 RepID=A0A3M8SSH5_9GAMM|nr:hypothetical protein [Lysobacter psychrotolerans]RNF84259.1 hypothetical protein EER27_07665 [Lysobacter psychrotolerans]